MTELSTNPTTHTSPEVLDQLAAACDLSDEARDIVDQTLTVAFAALSFTADAIVHKRGAPQEDKDSPRPILPDDALSVYVLARIVERAAEGERPIQVAP